MDPLHKWIGTIQPLQDVISEIFQMVLLPKYRTNKVPKPKAVENTVQLKRKEQSIYKPTDLWSKEEEVLAMKPDLTPCLTHSIIRTFTHTAYNAQNFDKLDVLLLIERKH
jgi:hypothetical protein